MRDVKIRLNTGEQKMVEWLTKARTKKDIEAGSKPTLWGKFENTPEDRYRSSLMGFGAEFAFCKMFNLYPDTSTHYRYGGCDAIWHGHRVDVKSVSSPTGGLSVKVGREGKADVWVLMYGNYPEYTLKGYVLSSDFINDKNIRVFTGTSEATYYLAQKDLTWLDQTDLFEYKDLWLNEQL